MPSARRRRSPARQARALTDYRELSAGRRGDDRRADGRALEVARPFLERGVHVLVEKPMAASLAEADALIAAARASGAMLAVGHTERFNPAIAAALPVLRDAALHRGAPARAAFPERSLDIDVVFDVMIHDLDIILARGSSRRS